VQVRPLPPPIVTGADEAPCGEAVYRAGQDGAVLVEFRLCPPVKGEPSQLSVDMPILIADE
jgi:hypothetical protein